MSRPGIDYLNPLTIAEIKNAGATFVGRYATTATRAELTNLTNAGLEVIALFEVSTNRALAGFGAGADDARQAYAAWHGLGMPQGMPVFMTYDFDDNANPAEILPYARGVDSVAGKGARAGYGGQATMKVLFDNGMIDFGFQTSAWSTGFDQRAQVRQVHDGSLYDTDEAVAANFGQWALTPILTDLQKSELETMTSHLPGIYLQNGHLTTTQLGELQTMLAHLKAIPQVG